MGMPTHLAWAPSELVHPTPDGGTEWMVRITASSGQLGRTHGSAPPPWLCHSFLEPEHIPCLPTPLRRRTAPRWSPPRPPPPSPRRLIRRRIPPPPPCPITSGLFSSSPATCSAK